MQPSQYDIQREVEALRDLRRRSTTPGALAIDPDLPNRSSQTSPTSTYWSGDGDASSSTSHDSDAINPDAPVAPLSSSTDDPFHLFWVPASVHPEIAPAEFRQFLKEHARNPGDGPSLDRSLSASSAPSGLGRKKSMLSRQYKPSENDNVEKEETIVPLRRNRTSFHANHGPQLTINDLQKLEELAEEASASDDPSKLRHILRRSLSLNVSPTALNAMDAIPEMGDEADSPIIVPPPGQILRRAARTKIRKTSLPGDGGGHRFGASRRGGAGRSGAKARDGAEKRTSSDQSSSDHSEALEPSSSKRTRKFSLDETQPQRDSFSEEASIFDAYVHDDEEPQPPQPEQPQPQPQPQQAPIVLVPKPQAPSTGGPPQLELPPPEPQSDLLEALGPVLQHPKPQRLLSPPQVAPEQQSQQSPSRTPSPAASDITQVSAPEPTETPTPTPSQPQIHHRPSPPPSPPTSLSKSKDKKGLFGKWGKSSGKDRERDNRERAEKEKESGFFGSIFGGKKTKEAEVPIAVDPSRGRETAQALLGQSRAYVPSPSPHPPGVNNWSRYPIHVERAIYRLSHIKLANPRRPLYEQVLISNLMFWYLGVINKAQANGEQEKREREQKERMEKEEREKKEKEEQEKPQAQGQKRETSPRRGPLTRPPPVGVGSGAGNGRRAEMPVKGPSYEMQHRVIEQEYGYPQQQGQRTPSPAAFPRQSPPPQVQQQQDGYSGQEQPFYYNANSENPRLPPGAMAPVDWSSSPQGNARRGSTEGGGNKPGRSLSATAVPAASPPLVNGNVRKGRSALASVPSRPRSSDGHTSHSNLNVNSHNYSQSYNGPGHKPAYGGHAQTPSGEEEDVPLAVWQQQRRR